MGTLASSPLFLLRIRTAPPTTDERGGGERAGEVQEGEREKKTNGLLSNRGINLEGRGRGVVKKERHKQRGKQEQIQR